jgi:phage tail tape-measure protein
MAKSKKWMSKAFANSHGQFKAKAKRAGKSTAEFAREKAGAPGKLGRQARLAERGMEASHKRRKALYGDD